MGRLKEITNRPANQPKTQKRPETRPEPAHLLWVVKVGEGRKYMGEGWACRYHRRFGGSVGGMAHPYSAVPPQGLML